MTKRVESLRAPCLDASSTLATSTFERAILFALFFRFVGSAVQPVASRATCLRVTVVAEAYCSAIVSLVRTAKKQINFLFVYPPNACNYVARLRSNTPTSVSSRLRRSFDSLLWLSASNPHLPHSLLSPISYLLSPIS